MTIAEIIKAGKGTAGHNGSWKVTCINEEHMSQALPGGYEPWPCYQLTHYGTVMLEWVVGKHGSYVVNAFTGHGSVSDQGGMNTAFKVLGLDLYYTRKGGGEIQECHSGTRIPIHNK